MGTPYSVDVRTRVWHYIAETKDTVQASQVFHVGRVMLGRHGKLCLTGPFNMRNVGHRFM